MPVELASAATWSRAVREVQEGNLVVFPTDTVYGVGCDPHNVKAIEAIYDAKGRDKQKAIPLLLSGPEHLAGVAASLPRAARVLGELFWPGGMTLVVPRAHGLPEELGGGTTIAVRVPDHHELRAFIAACGGIIAATSANRSGEPDATDATQAASYLSDKVALVVDGGATKGSVPSTVVDCTAEPPLILRAGALDPIHLEEALRAQGLSLTRDPGSAKSQQKS